ncbi:MAG: NAD(P)-dependent oxidoreductase [Sphingobacteriales bacterium]|nr:MAG: NAD(P)-dependent oxidoreductase [Sphingobacteriales bacterium]
MSFKNKTVFISGGTRGIGHAIGMRLAKEGANIVIAAKSTEPHPKLPGTIFIAAEDMEKAGGKGLAIKCDIRNEDEVINAVQQTVETFGGIDILINNASAINLTPTLALDMKRYDLMQDINTRGTYLCSQKCIPYLLKSENPHILNLSPPLTSITEHWFKNHVGYSIAKFGMSLCVLGMSGEFKGKIGVNGLWPRTTIATSAVQNLLGGDSIMNASRKPEILADAAYYILKRDAKITTGNYFVDDEVLESEGITNLDQYAVKPGTQLAPDFFI